MIVGILVVAFLLSGCGGGGGVPATGGGGDPRLATWWRIYDFQAEPKQVGDVFYLDSGGTWAYWAAGPAQAAPANTEPDAEGTWGATSTQIRFKTTKGFVGDGFDGTWDYELAQNSRLELKLERDYRDDNNRDWHLTVWLYEED